MFSDQHSALFISRGYIEPGRVTLLPEIFEGLPALSYSPETFASTLAGIPELVGSVRLVLAEELVYVTTLTLPKGTAVTRELIRRRAEEKIPEDLRHTSWDFRTMQYVAEPEESEGITVQVAVVEEHFGTMLQKALSQASFRVESILPESYVLASFEATEAGMTLIIEQNRESVLLVAAQSGSVLHTTLVSGMVRTEEVEAFLSFVMSESGRAVERITLSHISGDHLIQALCARGYVCFERSYNPLLGAFTEKISGKDDMVLNLRDTLIKPERSWWQKLIKRPVSA